MIDSIDSFFSPDFTKHRKTQKKTPKKINYLHIKFSIKINGSYRQYIYRRWNVIFIVTTLQFSHINSHIIHLFPTLSFSFLTIFLFINFSTYYYSSSNISPHFYIFISPLLYTLTLQFLHPFIFFYFDSSSLILFTI